MKKSFPDTFPYDNMSSEEQRAFMLGGLLLIRWTIEAHGSKDESALTLACYLVDLVDDWDDEDAAFRELARTARSCRLRFPAEFWRDASKWRQGLDKKETATGRESSW